MLGRSAVSVGCLTIDVDEDGRWAIEDGITAADAIAAIVRAPDLRGIMDRMTVQAEESARLLTMQTALAAKVRAERDAMNDGIGALWVALDRAGVRDDVDERYMQQVSEHCCKPAGEYRQADMLERVGFLVSERDTLAARVAELEAHNGRMVALITEIADACDDAGQEEFWDGAASLVVDALPGREWPDAADNLRRLAAGEVDDG